MVDLARAAAAHYRQLAAEIVELARRAQLHEVRRELLDLAEAFRRMAVHVEKRDPGLDHISID
jgi:hypothetical protein